MVNGQKTIVNPKKPMVNRQSSMVKKTIVNPKKQSSIAKNNRQH
jgi:hypothetical protein